jgi:hypothetical protein
MDDKKERSKSYASRGGRANPIAVPAKWRRSRILRINEVPESFRRVFFVDWKSAVLHHITKTLHKISHTIKSKSKKKHTLALATKSVMLNNPPEWASTKASTQVPASSFWICITWVKTTEPSARARYSMVGGTKDCVISFYETAEFTSIVRHGRRNCGYARRGHVRAKRCYK